MDIPQRQIRADFTDTTIVVYQAYPPDIAEAALAEGRFVPPFRRGRMTWIKPSFRWLMYRCGWAGKPGQERVLAVELTRAGFEEALGRACPSSYRPGRHADRATWARELKTSDVRVQWDPERSLRLAPLPYRSLQLGLSGATADRYVDEWLGGLTDLTARVREIRALLDAGDDTAAAAALPPERPYPLPDELAARIDATST